MPLFQQNKHAELLGCHLCAFGVKAGKITYPVMESQYDYGHVYGDMWLFSNKVKDFYIYNFYNQKRGNIQITESEIWG